MNQQNFGLAVIPAMAGFLLFGKRAKVEEIQESNRAQLPAVVTVNTDGQTGVGRYLMKSPMVTRVAKYLKNTEKHSMTGVSKYVLRQSISERNAPIPTGVSKYLAKAAKESPERKKSSVDKYLLKQEMAGKSVSLLTGVAKYQAEQNFLERKKAAAAMALRYKEEDEVQAKLKREAAEAAYASSNHSIVSGDTSDENIIPAATGIGRYLQAQIEITKKKPKTTSVSRYIAKKIIVDSQKPTVQISKVGKYLQKQALVEAKKSNLSGVAKYLSKQSTVKTEKPKAKPVDSGVSRYIASLSTVETNKPSLSGVSKYLEKIEASNIPNTVLGLPDHREQEQAASVLEGEFIPANAISVATGVSRYLKKQATEAVVAVATTNAEKKVTGVSKYISNQTTMSETSKKAALTGVDRYLTNRAA